MRKLAKMAEASLDDKKNKMIAFIDTLVQASSPPILIGIDGPSTSGKTSLAKALQDHFSCGLYHMDDFFLRPDQRTRERLNEVGGNVDYERFKAQVIDPLVEGQPVVYKPYNCQTKKYKPEYSVLRSPIHLIEGVYSHHPYFGPVYQGRIFLSVDKETQRDRVLRRNGPDLYDRFIKEWIPKENAYFDKFAIKEKSDLIIK